MIYKLLDILEDIDFGCEERENGIPAMAVAVLEDRDGNRFRHKMTDALENSEYGPSWKKDIYPAPSMLKEAIAREQLYVLIDKETFIGTMIVNSDANEAYDTFSWKHTWFKNEILVIHALGIHPSFSRRGYAKEMVRFVLAMAGAQGKRQCGWMS